MEREKEGRGQSRSKKTRARKQERQEGASSPFYSESGTPGCYCGAELRQKKMLTVTFVFRLH